MNKNKPLKKLKFYDRTLMIALISLTTLLISFVFLELALEQSLLDKIFFPILLISGICFIITLAIITWGMIYHEVKREEWSWLITTLIAFVIGIGGFIVSIIFYFAKMRSEFKRGRGVYDPVERIRRNRSISLDS
jgi:glucan phosphoethanolaminetransferase (alkaline phosphatase superfamily)